MATALVQKLLLIKYVPQEKNGRMGVNIVQDYITGKTDLHVEDSVDFTVQNKGTAKVYLFGSAVEILPGQSWSPPKSTPLPLNNNIPVTFEGDFQITRNIADLTSQANTSNN